jgi:FecR protein
VFKRKFPGISRLVTLIFVGILLAVILPALARDIQLPSSRWVEVRQIRGTVIYQGRPAKVGDRLRVSGEQITTGRGSSAVLAVDSGIATINVAENTTLQVKGLAIAANGGRVTLLSVPRGQARVQARRMSNPSSRLELSTPSGVAGVRGTEFGVGVGPGGKTGISTLEGVVAANAKGQTVTVNGGYSSLVFPGEPPTPPRLTQENLKYELEKLSAVSKDRVRLVCQVDPLNLVFLNDQPLEMDRNGNIDTIVSLSADYRFRLVIRSPLGGSKSYELGADLLR